MKITDIKTFNVYTYRTNYVFVKIETDEGISGIGEGHAGIQGTCPSGCH